MPKTATVDANGQVTVTHSNGYVEYFTPVPGTPYYAHGLNGTNGSGMYVAPGYAGTTSSTNWSPEMVGMRKIDANEFENMQATRAAMGLYVPTSPTDILMFADDFDVFKMPGNPDMSPGAFGQPTTGTEAIDGFGQDLIHPYVPPVADPGDLWPQFKTPTASDFNGDAPLHPTAIDPPTVANAIVPAPSPVQTMAPQLPAPTPLPTPNVVNTAGPLTTIPGAPSAAKTPFQVHVDIGGTQVPAWAIVAAGAAALYLLTRK